MDGVAGIAVERERRSAGVHDDADAYAYAARPDTLGECSLAVDLAVDRREDGVLRCVECDEEGISLRVDLPATVCIRSGEALWKQARLSVTARAQA